MGGDGASLYRAKCDLHAGQFRIGDGPGRQPAADRHADFNFSVPLGDRLRHDRLPADRRAGLQTRFGELLRLGRRFEFDVGREARADHRRHVADAALGRADCSTGRALELAVYLGLVRAGRLRRRVRLAIRSLSAPRSGSSDQFLAQRSALFRQPAPPGGQFRLVDGSCVFLNDSIDVQVFTALGTVDGGEMVSVETY